MAIDRTIIIVLIAFITIGLVFFLVLPEYREFKDLQKELTDKKAEYAKQYDYYNAIDNIFYDLQGQKSDLAKIDSALPKDSKLGEIINFLQRTIKDNNLTSRNLFFSKSSGKSVKSISFSIDLEGDYESLKEFMRALEESARIFEITNISFKSSAQPPYKFNLQIKTYTY
jgi:Tfp pilus assembly protein PilO